MKIISPDLCFKGARNYVHGTTIYQEIVGGAAQIAQHPADGPIRIDIRDPLLNQGNFHFKTKGDLNKVPAGITANFSVRCGKQTINGWVSDNGKPVLRRIPYEESLIWESLKIEEKQIVIHGSPLFDPFEICASMAVQLNNHLYPPEMKKKWLLSRIEFDHGIDKEDMKDLSLNHLQTFANRFTKSEVRNKQGAFGFLYFSIGSV